MSLGLRAGSKLHDVFGLLTPYAGKKLKDLAGLALAYARRHHLEAAFRSLHRGDTWQISFHPAAPDIRLSVEGGYAVLSAETLEVGPGYHAFVADFLGWLSRHHQWVWDVRNAGRGFTDDTGYFHDRDFIALQTLMAGEFAAMCEGLVETAAGSGPQAVWLPLEFTLAIGDFAATSLGFRDRAFFLSPKPALFFPWWEEGPTVQAVKNMALAKMWLDILWTVPAGATEHQDLENARALVDRARELGAQFTAAEGVDDLDALRRNEPLDDTADVRRIGYWRQAVWYLEPGGWSIALPACYREEIGDDGQLCTLRHGDRGVYVRSCRYDAEQTALEWPEPETDGYNEHLRFETDHYRAIVEASEMDGEDGKRWWVWEGTYNARAGSAVISVVSADETDAAWAEKVLRSVRPEAGDAAAE